MQGVAKKRKAVNDYTALQQRGPAAVPLPGKPVVTRTKPAPPASPKARVLPAKLLPFCGWQLVTVQRD